MTATDSQRLRNYAIFQSLSDEALTELAKHCRIEELAADKTLFHQNDPGDAMYMLESGQIHIIRQYPDGEHVILTTEGPYYVIGELSMLVNQPRTAAVVAVSDCTLITLERRAYVEVCEHLPDLAVKVQLYLARRLHHMNLLVREYAISNTAARVASLLWLLSGGEAGTLEANLRVSRMARAIATDADTVERILMGWDEAGYIQYDGTQLKILDVEMIRNIAG